MNLKSPGFFTETLGGSIPVVMVPMTIGCISLCMGGCGRTGIHSPFSIRLPIPIGTNMICFTPKWGGLKDIRIELGFAGAGYLIVESVFIYRCSLQVSKDGNETKAKKNEILLTKFKEGDVFKTFLSFFEVVL